jgi:hypothetical protein
MNAQAVVAAPANHVHDLDDAPPVPYSDVEADEAFDRNCSDAFSEAVNTTAAEGDGPEVLGSTGGSGDEPLEVLCRILTPRAQ